jgi:hypothetical protein
MFARHVQCKNREPMGSRVSGANKRAPKLAGANWQHEAKLIGTLARANERTHPLTTPVALRTPITFESGRRRSPHDYATIPTAPKIRSTRKIGLDSLQRFKRQVELSLLGFFRWYCRYSAGGRRDGAFVQWINYFSSPLAAVVIRRRKSLRQPGADRTISSRDAQKSRRN